MRRSLIREGIVVGLAGAVAVAAWFLLYDLAAGVPFRTPALLGAAIFDGLRDPAALVITPALVLKYTVLHGLAFLVFGIATAGLFALVDYERRVLFAVFMLFCCFEVFVIGMVMALAERLIEEIPIWAILGANLLAAGVMLGILFRSHHRMPREVLTAGE
jgi:cytochrome bd-type quinol oxidase subunit 2